MKRISKYIVIPVSFWEHTDLSFNEKKVMIDIDNIYDGSESGVAIGTKTLASMCGMSVKDIKDILGSLSAKGALSIYTNADGQQMMIPYMNKERYSVENIVPQEEPQPLRDLMPWDEIQSEWAKTCHMLPPIKRWTPQRKQKLRSCLKQADMSVEDLYKTFKIIASVAFLNGSSDKWYAHFDWIISKSVNLSKIFEGYYSKSYQEKQDYHAIIKGEDNNEKENEIFR